MKLPKPCESSSDDMAGMRKMRGCAVLAHEVQMLQLVNTKDVVSVHVFETQSPAKWRFPEIGVPPNHSKINPL